MALMQQQMQQQRLLMEAVRSLAEENQPVRSETPVTPLLPKSTTQKALQNSRQVAADDNENAAAAAPLHGTKSLGSITPKEPQLVTPKQEM